MINFGFSKNNRLQNSAQYRVLAKEGDKIKGKYFIVLYRFNQTAKEPRLGITVSKKCSKKAVVRNRIKRIVRESFRFNKDKLNYYEIIVIGRKYAISVENAALFNELGKMWQKLKKVSKSA